MAKGLAASNSSQNTEALLTQKFKGQLPFRLGPMTHPCEHCGALRFSEERRKENIRLGKELYLNCCQYGAVTLPLKFMPGGPLPPELLALYTGCDDGWFLDMTSITWDTD
ncbi:hypothetical protein DFH28DRAFT_894906 [Melampsora americana]|nr:hypothetical protein DFH28DRAFT_894906 [Melampsora americana]